MSTRSHCAVCSWQLCRVNLVPRQLYLGRPHPLVPSQVIYLSTIQSVLTAESRAALEPPGFCSPSRKAAPVQGRGGRMVVVGWSRVLWPPSPADSYLIAQEYTQLLFWDSPYHLSTELHCHTGEFICLLEHKETHGLEQKGCHQPSWA